VHVSQSQRSQRLNGCLNGTIPGICQPTAHCSSSINRPRPALLLRGQWTSEQRRGGSGIAAVGMSRSDYMLLYLGPVTVISQRLGDRFEVKLASFEFWCFRADLRPKTKMTETIKNSHFWCRKRNSVGLYI